MTATEHVILVDEDDNYLGTAEKMTAHRDGLCHRAFSVFIFRASYQGEILLQQRAADKYHSPGLWTNTCCSHPRPNEDIITAGQRRLMEEMGIQTALTNIGRFHYIAPFDNGLTENEVDYVLAGTITQSDCQVNPAEVQAYRWISIPNLFIELQQTPEKFTPWLAKALTVLTKNILT
jgi:isopentenyl-diphosphate delta-isomerase